MIEDAAAIERQRRINVLMWAYAYEFENVSIVSDEEFDATCYKIDLSIDCDYDDKVWDWWWRKYFQPHTGQWVHNHPDRDGLKAAFDRINKSFRS